MKYGILFGIVAVPLATTALLHRGWHYLLLWPALSFGIVALAYVHFGPRVFGKSPRGMLAPINQLMLLPYLVYAWSVWHALRTLKREAAFNQLTDNIFIGRRLLSHEFPDNIDHVIDLTCEFNEPEALRSSSYHSFQVLDGFITSPGQLRRWADQAAGLSGNIYIHCAEGHGRTGLFATVLLLRTGHSKTPNDALRFIRSRHPRVRLGQCQLAILHAIHEAARHRVTREE